MSRSAGAGIIVLLLLLISFSPGLAACEKGEPPPEPPAETPAPPEAVAPPPDENDEEDVPEIITVEEMIVYDAGGLVITLKGFEEGEKDKISSWPTFQFLIENGSSESLKIRTTEASVNGIMVNSYMMCEISPGESADAGMGLFSTDLKRANIEQIKEVEFIFHFIGGKSAYDYRYSDVIYIRTSAGDSYVQTYDDSGIVLIDMDDIKIVAQGLVYKYEGLDLDINLYLENNSGAGVRIREKTCAVNGVVFETFTDEVVLAGKKAYTALSFKKAELEDNGIESIDVVTIVFEISDSKTYDFLYDTEEVSIKF